MIITTEAVILRAHDYRESSRILRLYTRKFGKISAVAKGARGRKSRFGTGLEPMNYVTAVIYKKESRDLQLLSQCDLISPFHHLTDDMERMAAGMTVVELVDAVSHSEEENPALFSLLVNTLRAVDGATRSAVHALYYFEMQLLGILGFKPNLRSCFNCDAALGLGPSGSGVKKGFRVSYGGLLCGSCSAKGMGMEPVSAPAAMILQRLQEMGDPDAALRIAMTPTVRAEVQNTLRRFLLNHVEGLRSLKSEKVFSTMM